MQKSYLPEIGKALLIAFAVGYINPVLGVVAFFVVGAFLSKGSVPVKEMDKIIAEDTNNLDKLSEDLWSNPIYSEIPGNIYHDISKL